MSSTIRTTLAAIIFAQLATSGCAPDGAPLEVDRQEAAQVTTVPMLGDIPLASIFVQMTGQATGFGFATTAGERYLIRATGTAKTDPNQVANAQCWTSDGWATRQCGGHYGLGLDGQKLPLKGFRPYHDYEWVVLGTGQDFQMKIFDSPYHDNSGALKVEIFKMPFTYCEATIATLSVQGSTLRSVSSTNRVNCDGLVANLTGTGKIMYKASLDPNLAWFTLEEQSLSLPSTTESQVNLQAQANVPGYYITCTSGSSEVASIAWLCSDPVYLP